MVEKINSMQQVINLLEIQFKIMNKRLNDYDSNVLRVLKRLEEKNRELEFKELNDNCEIRIKSYMD
jgi:hypothetical protein